MAVVTPSASDRLSPLAGFVSGYASRFNQRFDGGHAVASPLGVWLLLALAAPAVPGSARADLETALGLDAAEATDRVRALLDQPHPAVHAAVALWARETRLDPDFTAWAGELPGPLERGPIPGQDWADAWAREKTGGMVERFPLRLTPASLLVLASALATEVSWFAPMATAPASRLGGDFGAEIQRCLVSPFDARQGFFDTDSAGRVAAHAVESGSGVRVVSVIGDPGRRPANVLAAAHQIAPLVAGVSLVDSAAVRVVDPFDLPLGAGHAWSVREKTEEQAAPPGTLVTRCTSYLPAWSVSSEHDLATAAGVPAVFEALARFVRPEDQPAQFEARQNVTASYTKTGFRAAAASAIGMSAGAAPQFATVRTREVTIRFNRPHAVVALTQGHGLWNGLPVVNAWVAEPADSD